MNIRLNGELVTLEGSGEQEQQLHDFLTAQGYKVGTIAVAINQSFVPRDSYQTTKIQENDKIDVVAPISGG